MTFKGAGMQRWSFFFALVCVGGCTTMCGKDHKDMEAGQVVEAYLQEAFNIRSVDDVEKLMVYTSGNLKQALEEADSRTIDQVFVQKRYEVRRFSFLEQKHLTPREREITYELEYQEIDEGVAQPAYYTIENSLNLIRKDGAWYITDVIGGRTAIDFIVADEVTREGVRPGDPAAQVDPAEVSSEDSEIQSTEDPPASP